MKRYATTTCAQIGLPNVLDGVMRASHCSGFVVWSTNVTWMGTRMAQPRTLRMTKMSLHILVKRRKMVASTPT